MGMIRISSSAPSATVFCMCACCGRNGAAVRFALGIVNYNSTLLERFWFLDYGKIVVSGRLLLLFQSVQFLAIVTASSGHHAQKNSAIKKRWNTDATDDTDTHGFFFHDTKFIQYNPLVIG